MYNITMAQADPEFFMNQFLSTQASTKANKWQGRNLTRWASDEYDKTFHEAESELDPVKRAAMFIKMNGLVVTNVVAIPIVNRPNVQAINAKLKAPMSGFANNTWLIQDWYKEA
jgi:peptide/nickel transport system substrate-binding protein